MKTLEERLIDVERLLTDAEYMAVDAALTANPEKSKRQRILVDALLTRLEREQVAVKLCGQSESDDLIENVQGLRMNLDAVTGHYKEMQERSDSVLAQCKVALDDARAELVISPEEDFGDGIRRAADRMRKVGYQNRELRGDIDRATKQIIMYVEERDTVRKTLEIGDSETLAEGVARVAANFAAFRALVKGIREDSRCPEHAGLRTHVRGLADAERDVRDIFGVLPQYNVQFGCTQVMLELTRCRKLTGTAEGQYLSDRIREINMARFDSVLRHSGRKFMLAQAHEEMTRLHGQIRARQEDIKMLQRTLEQNAERRRILEDGLKFYADSKHWNAKGPVGARWFEVTDIEQDMGQVALSALARSGNFLTLLHNDKPIGIVTEFTLNLKPGSSIAHAFGPNPWGVLYAPNYVQQQQTRAADAFHWQSRYGYGRI